MKNLSAGWRLFHVLPMLSFTQKSEATLDVVPVLFLFTAHLVFTTATMGGEVAAGAGRR
jgi:hypothetical protein